MNERDLERISLLLELQRPPEAEAMARAFLRENPDNGTVLRLLAISVQRQGRGLEARQAIALAVRAEPQEAMNHVVMAQLQAAASNMVAAVRAADEAIGLAPDHWEPYFVRADALRHGNASEQQQALADARQAIKIAPHSPDVHNLMGLCLDRLDSPTEQRAAYLEALRLDPHHALAQNNLAAMDIKRGHLKAGRRGLISALATRPNLDLTHRNHDILVSRVILRAWWVTAVIAGFEAYLLALGIVTPFRASSAAILVAANVAASAHVLGGASPALQSLRKVLQRSPRASTGLTLSWFAVLAAVGAFATKDPSGLDPGIFALSVLGGVVLAMTVAAIISRPAPG